MKTINMVTVAVALVGGCMAGGGGQATDQAALTGSGSGSGTGSGSGSGGGSGSGVWHSSMNGGAASVSAFTAPGSSTYVTAYELGTGTSRVTNLVFMFEGPDPASQVCYTVNDPWWGTYTYCYYAGYISETGFGTIPGDDFSVGGNASSARLHTTTGPGFYTERCSWGYNWGCESGFSESFDIAWTKNGAWSNSQSGTTSRTNGLWSQQTSGRAVTRSANVSGTAAGVSVTGGYAGITDTQGMTVTIDMARGGP